MRRAQSVSICENAKAQTQSRASLSPTLSPPPPETTAASTKMLESTTNTIVQIDPSEN